MTITNTYTAYVNISGTKVWDDNDNQDGLRPNNITVIVKNGDMEVDRKTVTPDAAGNWAYSFENLPKYDAAGNAITYTVSEAKVTGYNTQITGSIERFYHQKHPYT